MSAARRRDTKPEIDVRRILHARGLRYRVSYPIQGRPRRTIDIAFTRARIAVFLDGCFWHSCPAHGATPKANRIWWIDKLQANIARDNDTNAHLERQGWLVLRFWEHEAAEAVAGVLEVVVRSRQAPR